MSNYESKTNEGSYLDFAKFIKITLHRTKADPNH